MYDGYIRVSRTGGREGDSFISPDEQREKIEKLARATEIGVRMNEPELDVTGSKLERPILDAIMRRIESGQSEGVVVARVNRLSRAGLGDAIKLVERIDEAGATVAFAELGNIDPRSAQGEMVVNLWLLIARMQWREYAEKFDADKKRAVVEKGWFVGPTPLGFEKRDRTKAGKLYGKLYPTDDAPKVARLFEISAADGIHAALAYAEQTWPERSWSTFKVRRLLTNRIYKGEVVVGDLTGRIDPLVDEMTWEFAQHPLIERERRKAKRLYPLSGVARCAACGKTLVGHTTGRAGMKERSYRCTTKDCPMHVKAAPLEALVLDAVRAMPAKGEIAHDEPFKRSQAVIAARVEVERYVTSVSVADPELWQKGLAAREAACERAQMAFDELREQAASGMPDLDDPSLEVMQEAFKRAVADLTVKRGREPLPERVQLELAS